MAWQGKGMGHAMTGSRYNTYIFFWTQHGGMAASIRSKDYVQKCNNKAGWGPCLSELME